MINYYATLDVAENASDDDIKKAYRILAKKYHPDLNPGNAEYAQKFKEVNEANLVLGDEEKRKAYDKQIAAMKNAQNNNANQFYAAQQQAAYAAQQQAVMAQQQAAYAAQQAAAYAAQQQAILKAQQQAAILKAQKQGFMDPQSQAAILNAQRQQQVIAQQAAMAQQQAYAQAQVQQQQAAQKQAAAQSAMASQMNEQMKRQAYTQGYEQAKKEAKASVDAVENSLKKQISELSEKLSAAEKKARQSQDELHDVTEKMNNMALQKQMSAEHEKGSSSNEIVELYKKRDEENTKRLEDANKKIRNLENQLADAKDLSSMTTSSFNEKVEFERNKNQSILMMYDSEIQKNEAAQVKISRLENEIVILKQTLENTSTAMKTAMAKKEEELRQLQNKIDLKEQHNASQKRDSDNVVKREAEAAKREAEAAKREAEAAKRHLDNAKREAERRAQLEKQAQEKKEAQEKLEAARRAMQASKPAVKTAPLKTAAVKKEADFSGVEERRLKALEDKKAARGTLYGVLGVSIYATDAEIKSAYKQKEKILSPLILNKDEFALAKYKEIAAALRTLTFHEKRQKYNESIGVDANVFLKEQQARKEYEDFKKQAHIDKKAASEYWDRFDAQQELAESGDPEEQNLFGEFFYYGEEAAQSYESAVEWFEKASAQGHALATYNLGICYYYGEGVVTDEEYGLELITKAAKNGCPEGMDFCDELNIDYFG